MRLDMYVIVPKTFWVACLVLSLTVAGLAMHPNATAIQDPNGGTTSLDDPCGMCALDYTGLRYSGSGGQGGRGTIHWPGGSTGNNYGQMCFASTCEVLGNPLYAWCVDLYHPAETQNYGVDYFPAVITDDSCRKTQLTALAYLMAWNYPTTTFQDDATQLAIWKLSSIRDGGPNDGLPHFCYDAGIGYPNFGDTPTYPYVNTVYGTNPARNDTANAMVLNALGKNVVLPGDAMADECIGPNIVDDMATVTLKFCLTRGELATEIVNDTCVGNIKFICTMQVGDGEPTTQTVYTDENGCFQFDVTQSTLNPQPVAVSYCTNFSWPVGLVGCAEEDFTNNQWLVWALEPQDTCYYFEFPGDKWLSVELANFGAVSTTNGVDLEWTTASEADAQSWEVLRSVEGANQYAKIAELAAQNSATGATYHFGDRAGVTGTSYEYRLVDVDLSGVRTEHPGTAIAVFGTSPASVLEYSLADAYPNPFNPSTTLSFTLPEAAKVQLKIYDLSGREVAALVNGTISAGEHRVEWNAEGMPSGTYFYSLSAPGFTSTKKLLLLK